MFGCQSRVREERLLLSNPLRKGIRPRAESDGCSKVTKNPYHRTFKSRYLGSYCIINYEIGLVRTVIKRSIKLWKKSERNPSCRDGILLRDITGIKGKVWENLQETEVEDERVRDTRGTWESASESAIVRGSGVWENHPEFVLVREGA